MQGGGKLVAMGDVGTVSLLELCESLAESQANERKAIDMMFEREMKQEKNLEARERDLKRAKAQEAAERNVEAQDKKDAKDEKMEALLRKVDADFLAMIKEAEDDESKAAETPPSCLRSNLSRKHGFTLPPRRASVPGTDVVA